ncbi:MAG TPA: hypothetical protein PKC18_03225 [Lacipirellulaceae bacterium]|nr:hypothetical protein [Lacipirellulaceae bacterium]
MERASLVAEIIPLAPPCQPGAATEDARARLERLLEDSGDARMIYLRVADDTVTLNDVRQGRSNEHAAGAVHRKRGFERSRGGTRMRWVAALALAAALAGIVFWLKPDAWLNGVGGPVVPSQQTFARVVSLSGVEWSEGAETLREWARLGQGKVLAINTGSIELLYDNGVQFVLQGPAHCQLVDEKHVLAKSGKLVARVGPEAIGFRIVTPHTTVIDRGTSFGLTIDPERQTDVVVYEGIVDLALGTSQAPAKHRLATGEALRVGRDGRVGRIASVAGDAFLPPPRLSGLESDESRVIVSVTDNLKSTDTSKYYRVVSRGLREDCQAYVDRRHQWNGVDDRGIPPFLLGADYVMTFNDDKVQHDLRIAVTLARPARLYLFIDERAEAPRWLTEEFVKTGWVIGSDEGYDDVPEVTTAIGPGKSIENTFSVWARDVAQPSTVVLGALQEEQTTSPPREVLRAMYGIAATPLAGASDIPSAR